MKKVYFLIPLLLLIALNCSSPEKHAMQRLSSLETLAGNINTDLASIRAEVQALAVDIHHYYIARDSILPHINTSIYTVSASGVMYKPVDDGGSAVFVSGYVPVTPEIKKIVYFTEPVDAALKRLVKKYPEIAQVYFNDKNSYNRIYPFFDVLAQYEAKMNIPDYNFYYMADAKHNPGKTAVWVREPYVDPAGRGWMVSAIAPVYVDTALVGVPGIDITINTLTDRYIKDTPDRMFLLIDATGVIVTAQEAAILMLSFPKLKDHKYVETIKLDTYRKESYNLFLGQEPGAREIADKVIKQKLTNFPVTIGTEHCYVIASVIPEVNWYLIEIVK
ncbi:MAG: hypothetical protein LWX56_02485 [Ignavibacteria bacterium]|nr:hypothetical protein [Ignavibacteria bacterium]